MAGRGELKLEISGVTFKQYQDIKKQLKDVSQIKDLSCEFHNNNVEAFDPVDTGAEKPPKSSPTAFRPGGGGCVSECD